MSALGPDSEVGHFRVVRKLGAGGMGVVYLARDLDLRRDVALKVLPPELMADEERRVRFLREACSAAAVTHAHIATVYEVGEDDGRVFIAMEYIEGTSLREALADGVLPVSDALRIVRQVLRALGKAHDAGIVHRDLKPDNVMLNSEGSVKLLDFGLAKLRADESLEEQSEEDAESGETVTAITAEGRVLGTPGYMAPEQAMGKEVDARADLFSLGTIMHEMLSGQRTFSGDTPMELVVATTRDEPVAITTLNDDVSDEVAGFIQRSLAKAPDDRFGSAGEMLTALADLAPSMHSGELPAPTRRSQRGAPETAAAVAQRPSRRLIVAGLAVMMVVAGALYMSTRSDEGTAPAASTSVKATATAGTPITALPLPQSTNQKAVEAYRQGIQAFRDSSWETAHGKFKEASELDPKMAEAHFRLAQASFGRVTERGEARAAFRRATMLRASMSERNQAFLNALEPYLLGDPPNASETIKRLRALTSTYPGDAEIWTNIGFMLLTRAAPDEAKEAAERGLACDPRYGDAWQTKGVALIQMGRLDDARKALAQCVSVSPLAVDCLLDLTHLESNRGKCGQVRSHASAALSANPGSFKAGVLFAQSLAALDAPDDAVLKALTRMGSAHGADESERLRLEWTARLRVLRGEFAAAAKLLNEELALFADFEDGGSQQDAWRLLLQINQETGDEASAASLADRYLAQRAAWTVRSSNVDTMGAADGPLSDASLPMHRAALEAGAIDSGALEAERARFAQTWHKGGSDERLLWLSSWATSVRTVEDAKRALAELPKEMTAAPYHRNPEAAASLARVYALGGEGEKALPLLEQAATGCWAMTEPVVHTQLHLLLGAAYEQAADNEKACKAYAVVRSRWGAEANKSLSGAEAAKRSRNLSCP